VSGEIASRIGDGFVLGRSALLPVKGKTEPVRVVEVLAPAEDVEVPAASASGEALPETDASR
jgi:hypothetical protein